MSYNKNIQTQEKGYFLYLRDIVEQLKEYFEFRMHPRRAGSYANAYYAAKRAARSYKRGGGGGNNNGGGNGCGGCLVLLFLFCASWFISFWSLLFTDMDSGTATIVAIPMSIMLVLLLDKITTTKQPNSNANIEDEITRREFFQQYEFRKYNPVNHPYVLGIATGAKTYRYTINDVKSFWVDFDSFENQVLLHISDNTFSLSKTAQNQKDIDFFISFIMQCGGLNTRGKIPTEPPDQK